MEKIHYKLPVLSLNWGSEDKTERDKGGDRVSLGNKTTHIGDKELVLETNQHFIKGDKLVKTLQTSLRLGHQKQKKFLHPDHNKEQEQLVCSGVESGITHENTALGGQDYHMFSQTATRNAHTHIPTYVYLGNMPRSLLLQLKQNLTEGPPLFERLNLLPLLKNFLVSTHDSLGTAVQTDREVVT